MTEGLPPLVDTHCHLVLLEERGLLDQALEGALAAGVDEIVSVGLNLEDSPRSTRGSTSRVGGIPTRRQPPTPASSMR